MHSRIQQLRWCLIRMLAGKSTVLINAKFSPTGAEIDSNTRGGLVSGCHFVGSLKAPPTAVIEPSASR